MTHIIVLARTKTPAIKTIKKRKNFSFEVPILNNEKDLKLLSDDIDYICNKKIVKPVSTLKQASNNILNFLKKNV